MRTTRRKKLSDYEHDNMLEELKALDHIVAQYNPSPIFDAELFEQTVKSITVIDNATIRFKLLGNIELNETINEKGRCKSRESTSDSVRI